MRKGAQILSERLVLVGAAAKLNAEHVRLLQMAAGAQIATMHDDSGEAINPHQSTIEAIAARLRVIDDKIAELDRELESL